MRLQTIAAPVAFRTHIHSYWSIRAVKHAVCLDLVPDGYPELGFFQSGGLSQMRPLAPKADMNQCVIGQFDFRSRLWVAPKTEAYFVKLQPWFFGALFPHIDLSKWRNSLIDPTELDSQIDWQNWGQQLIEQPNLSEFAGQWQHLISPILRSDLYQFETVRQFSQHIIQKRGQIAMDDLLGLSRISSRQLQRKFSQQLGMTPKRYCRILRVKRASLLLLKDYNCQLLLKDLAYSLNYYDQSHFLKDFRTVAGVSPSHFRHLSLPYRHEDHETYLSQWD